MDLLFRAASQRPKFGVAKRLLGTAAAAFLLCCSSGILLMVLVDGGDRDLGGGDRDLGGGERDLDGGDRDLERLLDGGGDRRRGDGEGGRSGNHGRHGVLENILLTTLVSIGYSESIPNRCSDDVGYRLH